MFNPPSFFNLMLNKLFKIFERPRQRQNDNKTNKNIKYRDIFYGKKRIAFVLTIIFAAIAACVVTLLVKLAGITEATFKLEKVKYSSVEPTKINFAFKLENFKSPLHFSISKLQVKIDDNIKVKADTISVKKQEEFRIDCTLNMEKCDCEGFDFKNFKFEVECKLKVSFLLIPFAFIINFSRNMNIWSRGKTSRDWYNELGLKTDAKHYQTWESSISSVDKKTFFNSTLGPDTEIDVDFSDLYMFFKPEVFTMVIFHGFKYNKDNKEGRLSMEFIKEYKNNVFQTYLLDFFEFNKPLVLDRLEQNGKAHKISFNPLYRKKPDVIPKFTQPWVALQNLQMDEEMSFDIHFASNTFYDFMYMCTYYFLKNLTFKFEGRQNTKLVCEGKITMKERGAHIDLNIVDYDVFFRFCIYPEPRMSFDLVESYIPMLSLVEGMKFVTNIFKNFQLFYKNRVLNMLESPVTFSKYFLVNHYMREKGEEGRKNKMEIESVCKFRSLEELDMDDLSEYALLDLAKDIEFAPIASRFDGHGRIVKGQFYMKNTTDSTSNKMFGTYRQVALLDFHETALEILNVKDADAIFNLFGTGFGFIFKNGKKFSIAQLLTGPNMYGFPNYVTKDNYNDKSLFVDNDNKREDPRVKFGKFSLKLKNYVHLVNLDGFLSSAEGCSFENFVKEVFPDENQLMIFEQIMHFSEIKTTIACTKGDVKIDFCDMRTIGDSEMRFSFIDGNFYLDMPKASVASVNIFSSFLTGEDIIFKPKDGCWIGAIIGNFTKIQVTRKDTPMSKKWMADWDNFGVDLNFQIGEDSYLDLTLDISLPQEMCDTAESIEFLNFFPIQIKADNVVEGCLFELNVDRVVVNEKTFTVRVKCRFNMNLKTDMAALSFTLQCSYANAEMISKELNTADFFKWLYRKEIRTWDEYEQACLSQLPKLICFDLKGEKEIRGNSQVLKLRTKFYLELDMIITEIGAKISEIVKSRFFAPSFFFRYNFKNLAIIDVLYRNKVIIRAGKLETKGSFIYPLAYSSVIYNIQPKNGESTELYYDCPFKLHKAFFSRDSDEYFVYFNDRNIVSCEMKCCSDTDSKYMVSTRSEHKLHIIGRRETFYKYQTLKGKDIEGENTIDVFFNPHIEKCTGAVEAEVEFFNDMGEETALDFKQFGVKSPLCLGFVKMQEMLVTEKLVTSIFFAKFEDTFAELQIHISCPIQFMIDDTVGKVWLTLIASLGDNYFAMVDFRDRFDDPEMDDMGHNFVVNAFLAKANESNELKKYKSNFPALANNTHIYMSTNGTTLLVDYTKQYNLPDWKARLFIYIAFLKVSEYFLGATIGHLPKITKSAHDLCHSRFKNGDTQFYFQGRNKEYDCFRWFISRSIIAPRTSWVLRQKEKIFEESIQNLYGEYGSQG